MNATYALTKLINLVFGLAEAFLGLRFILRLLGANPEADFVSWLYAMSDPLLDPFRGIFPTVVEGQFIIEFSTLFAILIYALVAWLLTQLVIGITKSVRS